MKLKEKKYRLIWFLLKETSEQIREFLTLLGTCHTVVPENKLHTDSLADIAYQASSPGRIQSCQNIPIATYFR